LLPNLSFSSFLMNPPPVLTHRLLGTFFNYSRSLPTMDKQSSALYINHQQCFSRISTAYSFWLRVVEPSILDRLEPARTSSSITSSEMARHPAPEARTRPSGCSRRLEPPEVVSPKLTGTKLGLTVPNGQRFEKNWTQWSENESLRSQSRRVETPSKNSHHPFRYRHMRF